MRSCLRFCFHADTDRACSLYLLMLLRRFFYLWSCTSGTKSFQTFKGYTKVSSGNEIIAVILKTFFWTVCLFSLSFWTSSFWRKFLFLVLVIYFQSHSGYISSFVLTIARTNWQFIFQIISDLYCFKRVIAYALVVLVLHSLFSKASRTCNFDMKNTALCQWQLSELSKRTNFKTFLHPK